MAKGNIGNLLQHFVALRVSERLINTWNRPQEPIEYIDCYSMAPWEKITGRQPQGFVDRVRAFPAKRTSGDLVASAFLEAWNNRYDSESFPEHPQDRDYPNTAVLLRSGFPSQCWRMRLHEDDSTGKGKRDLLSKWAAEQSIGEYSVAGNWPTSKLICNSPAPSSQPVIVMLDPFQIVHDENSRADKNGYLPTRLLRFVAGQHALHLGGRAECKNAAPLAITLFSYSDVKPEVPDGIIRRQFDRNGWSIDRVRSVPLQGRAGASCHQGWIVSTGITTPLLGLKAQDAWDAWNQP